LLPLVRVYQVKLLEQALLGMVPLVVRRALQQGQALESLEC